MFDDHPFGCQLGCELDSLDSLLISRIGAADEQAAPALSQNDDLVLGGKFGIHHVARQPLQIGSGQVEQGKRQRVG